MKHLTNREQLRWAVSFSPVQVWERYKINEGLGIPAKFWSLTG